MQQPRRLYATGGAFVVFVVLAVYYISGVHERLGSSFTPTNVQVKVISGTLGDEQLAKLDKSSFNYLAMIDAGSSGCRAHVYRYGRLDSASGPLYIIPKHDSKKVKPGLSSFAGNPSDAGVSLQGLVDFIKEQVPESEWKSTPIWLKATAGLRMLSKSESNAILESVRAFLGDDEKSPFVFRPPHARIISGNEEGGFGWIAFNYLKKIIGPKRQADMSPYAVVEMGGASSQVSQVAPSAKDAAAIPDEYKFSFTIEGQSYHLYTHSYLGYGAEQAREGLNKLVATSATAGSTKDISDPCLNVGYKRDASAKRKEVYEGPDTGTGVVGFSNGRQCMPMLSKLFESKKTCDVQYTKPYSFDCVHQPAFVAASENFLVFENFYYVSSALGIGARDGSKSGTQYPLLTSPASFKGASDEICAVEWSQAQTTFPKDSQPKDTNIKLCFAASYAHQFLIKGLGLSEDKKVTIQREVEGSEIEWALGAAYKEVADFLVMKSSFRPNK